MTQEDKELVLIDLCARLLYMPKIKIIYQQQGIKGTDEGRVSCDFIEKIVNDLRNGVITDIQIYLRPMEDMTEEEREEYRIIDDRSYSCPMEYAHIPASDKIDWLNKKMFDYRGLIPRGLALPAPKGMYKWQKD